MYDWVTVEWWFHIRDWSSLLKQNFIQPILLVLVARSYFSDGGFSIIQTIMASAAGTMTTKRPERKLICCYFFNEINPQSWKCKKCGKSKSKNDGGWTNLLDHLWTCAGDDYCCTTMPNRKMRWMDWSKELAIPRERDVWVDWVCDHGDLTCRICWLPLHC